MQKYNTIDRTFLKRYFDLLVKHKRFVDKKYNRCAKEVFIERTLNKWLSDKYFVVINHESTGIFTDTNDYCNTHTSQIKKAKKHYIAINNCRFSLGYAEDIDIYFSDPFISMVCNYKTLSYNDFFNLQFIEIGKEDYENINELFIDDREDTLFEFVAFTKKMIGKGKNKKLEEIKVKVYAIDYQEAFNFAIKNYPDYVIYQ